ncbi:hypothetical protein PMIN06_003466 [Paraphaeosphaeria minitans]
MLCLCSCVGTDYTTSVQRLGAAEKSTASTQQSVSFKREEGRLSTADCRLQWENGPVSFTLALRQPEGTRAPDFQRLTPAPLANLSALASPVPVFRRGSSRGTRFSAASACVGKYNAAYVSLRRARSARNHQPSGPATWQFRRQRVPNEDNNATARFANRIASL